MDEHAPYAHLAPEDAFRLAIMRSDYPVKELCKRLGWTESFLRRVLSIEKYFPSYEDIPLFCAAVGNTIVIEWLMARSAAVAQNFPNVTPGLLQGAVLDLSVELGDVAGRVRAAIEDGIITKQENRGILKDILELIGEAVELAGTLRDFDRRIARS